VFKPNSAHSAQSEGMVRAERLAGWIGGGPLFALTAYVLVSAGWSLWTHHGAEFAISGLVISVLAIPIMH
jgi:hypothetical protein